VKGIFNNDILWKALLVVLITQFLKVIHNLIKLKKWNWRWIVEMGGMPSSHTASTVALSTMIGIREGFSSSIFALSAFFTFIVMYDAAGLRRAVGKQAYILNSIMEELASTGKIKEEKLKELLGHTPFEVFAGLILGIILGVILA
jgi:hypothetical protein